MFIATCRHNGNILGVDPHLFYAATDLIEMIPNMENADGLPDSAIEIWEVKHVGRLNEIKDNGMPDTTWPIWTLSGGDIEGVFKENGGEEHYGVSYSELDIDNVARSFLKAIESMLGSGYDWTEILDDAIRENAK